MKAGAAGAATTSMVMVVNHDVPTDPVKLRATRLAQADAAIASAQAKIDKLSGFLAIAPKDRKARQRAHLEGAQKALAEAIAVKKGLL